MCCAWLASMRVWTPPLSARALTSKSSFAVSPGRAAVTAADEPLRSAVRRLIKLLIKSASPVLVAPLVAGVTLAASDKGMAAWSVLPA